MKKFKKKPTPEVGSASAHPQQDSQFSWGVYGFSILAFLAALLLFAVYQPALGGPFLFDDTYLPMLTPNGADQPFASWVKGVRPVLMASYWANARLSGLDPYAFKLANVFIHFGAGILVWLWVRKVTLQILGHRDGLFASAFVTLVFLFHPLQTDSVAYVAGRSESLSGALTLAALVLFLYRGKVAIGWGRSLAVLLCFSLALGVKEHSVILLFLMALSDYFFNPGFSFRGVRQNWRVYLPILIAGLVGAIATLRVLSVADSAGFGLKELTWNEYFLTQVRTIFGYIWLFLAPISQNADHDQAISHSLLDHGSLVALLGLLGLTFTAWYFRKQLPLASYGFFVFLILLSPTSSVVPIKDTFVERRMYLPLVGLCLIFAHFLTMPRLSSKARIAILATVSLVCGYASFVRNEVWSSELAFWQDAAAKSPRKSRPVFQLAYNQYMAGKCEEALRGFAQVEKLEKPDYRLYADWALAADCAGRLQLALDKLNLGEAIENNVHVHATKAMIFAKQGKTEPALNELDAADKINPNFVMSHFYRGNIYFGQKEYDKAVQAYNKCLELDPNHQAARQALAMIFQQKRRDKQGGK